MKAAPPKEQQIQALLLGQAYNFAREWSGKKILTDKIYSKVFTVRRQEVISYVKKFGFPKNSFHRFPANMDGYYLFKEDSAFVIYFQERGVLNFQASFATKEDAEATMVDFLLRASGTGLF